MDLKYQPLVSAFLAQQIPDFAPYLDNHRPGPGEFPIQL